MMLLEEDGTVLLRRPGGEGWIGRSLATDPMFVQFSPRLRPGTYHEIAVDDRIERVTTYRTVQGYPMVIAIGLPADAILLPWRERSSKLLLVQALTGLALSLHRGGRGLPGAQSRRSEPSPQLTRSSGQPRALRMTAAPAISRGLSTTSSRTLPLGPLPRHRYRRHLYRCRSL